MDINAEAKLQREIRDIIDELDIMIHIVRQEEEVITRFVKKAREILERDDKGKNTNKPVVRIQHSDGTWSDIEVKLSSHSNEQASQGMSGASTQKQPDKGDSLGSQAREAFDSRSNDLLSEISDRIKELEGLKRLAESTAQNVSDHTHRRDGDERLIWRAGQ